MELTLNIKMDNAAFDDGNDGRYEAARILRGAADKLESGADYAPMMDVNGNKVGELNIDE